MAEPDPEKEIDEQYELPDGWMWTKIGEIGKLYRGVSYKKEQASKEPKGEHVPILRANNINFCINLDDLVYVPLERVNEEQFIRAGDIIICMSSGSKNLVGKAAQAENNIYGGFGTFCAALRVNNMINKKYVGFFFQSSFYRNVISQISRGVNINNLRREHIDFMHIPLPPLSEQHRIVTKLEALLAQVNRSKDHLAKVPPLIKRFRQSVLAAACSGRLTEDWRREHPDVEPASELLNRIRKERIRRYDEECRKAEAKGRKKPKKPKNIEPQVVDAEGLPELPGGWVWVVFDQIAKAENNAIKAGPFGSSLKKEFYVTKGYKIYGQEQVIRGDSHYGEYYIDEEKYNELITCSVQPGDILISLVGTIGKTLILPSNIEPGIINPRLVKISLDNKIGFNEYIQGYLNSTSAEKFYEISSHGGTMEILNLRILRALPIPLPPLPEQHEIVQHVGNLFHFAGEVEQRVAKATAHTNHLTQSILARAFRGELVQQDPRDEPASLLLERMKHERAKNEMEKKTGKRKAKTLLDYC